MQLFPGRTPEELDEIDEARLYRALEARALGRQCQIIRDWLHGKATSNQLRRVKPELRKEFMDVHKAVSARASHKRKK